MSLHVHLLPSLDAAQVGAELQVGGSEGHHAVVVRRLRVGERVNLTDGRGRSATAEVVSTDRSAFRARVAAVEDHPRPEPALVVVQALPKGDRGELAVEVLTEVGVDRVVPWTAERSQVSWRGPRGEKALARWRSTAREAAKQARRAWHPTVDDPASTAQVAELLAGSALGAVLHEDADEPLAGLDVPAAGVITVVVGPEGGLTDAELEAFTGAGGVAVRLGSEVLRTSTAGLAAAAALLARTPRWS